MSRVRDPSFGAGDRARGRQRDNVAGGMRVLRDPERQRWLETGGNACGTTSRRHARVLEGPSTPQTRLTLMSTCFDVFKSAIALATDERCSRAIAFSTDERSSAAAFWRQMQTTMRTTHSVRQQPPIGSAITRMSVRPVRPRAAPMESHAAVRPMRRCRAGSRHRRS